MTDQEMMGRYIYEVISRVPKEQRDEIQMELEELISDMCELEGATMESVLTKLGNPIEFAKRYRDDKGYVVSPEYYDNYMWVLKIVLICVGISSILSAIVGGITDGLFILDIFIEMIAESIASILAAFGSVTLIFAILERQKVKVDLKQEKEWSINNFTENGELDKKVWSPIELAPIPDKRSLISRGDSIFSIIFIVIFSGLLIFAPQLFGAYVFEEKEFIRSIPLFNLDKWGLILPFLLLSFLLAFVDEMIKLVTGCYCKLVMVSNIITGIGQLILSVIAIKVFPFWNPNFINDVGQQFNKSFTSHQDIMHYFGTDFFSNIVIAIIFFVTILELGTTIYKTLRYGTV